MLKYLLAVMILPLYLLGREAYVQSENQGYYVEIEETTTLGELEKEIKAQMGEENVSKAVVTIDLEDNTALAKCDAKHRGGFIGYPRDFYAKLTAQEVADIKYIVNFLGNHSLMSIAFNRSDLEAAGDRIEHIHPLRFLGVVFTDEELKVSIRNVRGKGWVWGDFVGGIKESLNTEVANRNITEAHIKDFAKMVGIDPRLISNAINTRSWDEFIDILINKIPRQGNHGRFDS